MKKHYKYTFKEIFLGQKEDFHVVISQEMQEMFHKISGDNHILHTDENYAKSVGYPGVLVYGGLTASLYSRVVGTLFCVEGCMSLNYDIKYRNLVYVGDTLHVTGEVVEKNDTFKLITIKALIRNQNDVIVSSANLKIGSKLS